MGSMGRPTAAIASGGQGPTDCLRRMEVHAWRRRFALFALIHGALWTVAPILTQPNPPLDVLEIVAWGHEWQMGYHKHPPLTAWLAEAARLVSGTQGTWAIYLLSQVAVVAAFWCTFELALHYLSPARAFLAVLLLEAAPHFTRDTVEFNHAVNVLPFFAGAMLCFYRALSTGRLAWWLATGSCLGLGMLAKYVIGFLALPMAALIVWDREARRSLSTPGPYLAFAVMIIVLMPHLFWVVERRFETLTYILHRSPRIRGLLGHIINPLRFAGGNLLNLAPILVAAVPVLAWPWRLRPSDPDERLKRRLLLTAVFGPAVALAGLSLVTGMSVRHAWAIPTWSGVGLLLLFFVTSKPSDRGVHRAMTVCVILGVVNLVSAVVIDLYGSTWTGRPRRVHFPGRALTQRVSDEWQRRFHTPLRLVGGEKWISENIAFFAPSRPSTFTNKFATNASLEPDASPWTGFDDFARRGGILVWDARREGEALPQALGAHFPQAEVLPPILLPWQTQANVMPLLVGIALVAPGSRAVATPGTRGMRATTPRMGAGETLEVGGRSACIAPGVTGLRGHGCAGKRDPAGMSSLDPLPRSVF